MAANKYHFITHWKVDATCEEVYRTLEDINTLATWWPSVYLDVKVLRKGQPGGVGKVVALYTKGWLPYTLRWQFTVTQTNFPTGFALTAHGDLTGSGVWTFTRQDATCVVTYDWQIDAEKPLLRYLSFLMKPLFAANHRWAMKKGEESLALELLRRRAAATGEHVNIPPPPKPTFPHNLTRNKIL
ncbi:MAG TPA: SRPBCC family protein [Chitinophagaceae bacterium]|nr:SRPBCC family protein [Chitinophagaceae bacterium]